MAEHQYTAIMTISKTHHSLANGKTTAKNCKKDIQQLEFVGRHRPGYYSTDLKLMYGRADGMPSFLESMVVCAQLIDIKANIVI